MPTKINEGRWETELGGRSWRFFYEVDEFLSGNPCSKPKVVFNPSQIVIADGTEDSEEESKGNVENVEPGLPFNNSNNKARKFRTLKRFLCDMYR